MNDPAKPTAPGPALPAATPCANCGVTLQGEYCHHCGQPLKGMIRPLSGLTADVIDSVFNIDSRILRTIGPLYLKPGFLTTEYFIGRRQRYVTPFRLFFFLTIVAFLVTQFAADRSGLTNSASTWLKFGGDSIAEATTPENVLRYRDEALKGIDQATRHGMMPAEARAEIEKARDEIRKQAQERLDYLRRVQDAKALGQPPPPPPLPSEEWDPSVQPPAVPETPGEPHPPVPPIPPVDKQNQIGFNFNGSGWDPKTNPVTFDWLPEAGNTKLNEMIGKFIENGKLLRTDPKRVVAALFGVLPQALFVLMPLFALMLKVFFIFKRRYYMEHLIVALHSHAFLMQSLLLISLLELAALTWPAVATPLHWGVVAASWWIPLYLLLMQKRVYRQNWFMTVLKFSVIGTCYSMLVSFAVVLAFVITLATV